jgi:hypothetical protein
VIADRYEGEWRDGWRHGQGVYDFTNGDRYEGEWFEGLRTGRGTMVWADGARYEGEWLDGRRKMAVSATPRDCGFE